MKSNLTSQLTYYSCVLKHYSLSFMPDSELCKSVSSCSVSPYSMSVMEGGDSRRFQRYSSALQSVAFHKSCILQYDVQCAVS